MSLASWLWYGLLVLLGAAGVGWLYLRREPRGPGRPLLAALRATVLAVVLLLLFDPQLPSARGGPRGPGRGILLDASASMGLAVGPGDTTARWTAALGEVRRRPGDVLLFGSRVRPADRDSLPAAAPGDNRSLLLPALRAAAEAGLDRVTVISDGALEGAATLPAWLARLGLEVSWVQVGQPLGGLALSEASAPAWAEAGTPIDLQLTVSAASPAPDSARLVVRQGERVLAERVVTAPPSGRSVQLRLPAVPAAPPEGGHVLLEVALEPGDVLPDDDRRTLSIFVSAEPAGVAVVSLVPDQEPRFLLPVLARSLGLPVRGYLRTGLGWIRLAEGSQAGERVPEQVVAQAAARAQLLVLQAGRDAPDWAVAALRSGPPLLVLMGEGSAGLPLPVSAGPAGEADWFADPEVPASPIAAQLAGAVTAELPPLPALHPAEAPAGSWAPLLVTRGRGGESRPLLLAGQSGSRRWAVALAEGHWRWAFMGAGGRELYDRLWSGVAGWLVGEAGAGLPGVRPVSRVVARGESSRWVVPGLRPDSLRLRLAPAAGGAVLDTVLAIAGGDTLQAPLLPPGSYRYDAVAWAGERQLEGEGELAVESWSPELDRPAARLADLEAPSRVAAAGREDRGRRALHTSPVPYVLLVLLLAAEWILRRRWGLR